MEQETKEKMEQLTLLEREESDHEEEDESSEEEEKEAKTSADYARSVMNITPAWSFIQKEGFIVNELCTFFPILILTNLLTPKQCESLLEYGRPKWEKRKDTSQRYVALTKNGRVSSHPVLHQLQKKISAMGWYPIEYMEEIQLWHYEASDTEKGAEKLSHDLLPYTSVGNEGNRVLSFHLHLNTVKEEQKGQLIFPTLELKVQAQAGTGLMWPNCDFQSKREFPEVQHFMDELAEGADKWVLKVWLRQRNFPY
jgi:hypothetical protein